MTVLAYILRQQCVYIDHINNPIPSHKSRYLQVNAFFSLFENFVLIKSLNKIIESHITSSNIFGWNTLKENSKKENERKEKRKQREEEN